jgi:hypothetical protein
MDCKEVDDALTLIRMEYLEMPDLKLTLVQARRLWNLPADLCELAMRSLVETGFLARTAEGRFVRRDPPPARIADLLRACS